MPEDYQQSLEKAQFQYDAAFHLLTVTHPLVKDPKLLLGILNNILASMEHAMDSLLQYEKQLQLVPNYGSTFLEKLNTFRLKSSRRNNILPEHTQTLTTIKEILNLHKVSPMEFKRHDRLVICSKDYHLQQLSAADIREYLDYNKAFLDKISVIINRKE